MPSQSLIKNQLVPILLTRVDDQSRLLVALLRYHDDDALAEYGTLLQFLR